MKLEESGASLIVRSMSGAEITRHIMPAGRGNKVIHKSHQRDTSMKIAALTAQVVGLFTDKDGMTMYLARVRDNYGRYMRDQLLAIAEACMGLEQTDIDHALDRCLKNGLFSANDFKAAVGSGTKSAAKEDEQPEIKPVGDERTRAMASFRPAKSSLDAYEDVVKRAV